MRGRPLEEDKEEKARNTFQPKVLASVSHHDRWFVGSSLAVSHYLRPLYLYKRILDFKPSLKKAVVYFEPLETEHAEVDWTCSAFWFQGEYKNVTGPCENCKHMFKNLKGFLRGDETHNLGGEGASANTVRKSFLAACGEYPPTNQCLLNESDNEAVNIALTNFRGKCLAYFKDFNDIVLKCDNAYKSYCRSEKKESEKVKILRNAYDEYVKDRIHIFGIKPECNRSLSHNV